MGLAHAFIETIAGAGADAVKFQTHIADAESTLEEPWRIEFSVQDRTRYDYWKRMEFSEEQWKGLKVHAEEKGLIFLSSPHSVEAVELLKRIGMPAWKIPSGEVNNPYLLDEISKIGLPVILSSGMSYLNDLDHTVDRLRQAHLPLALMQCTSVYPCPANKIGLNVISVFRDRYNCPAGLSDHSGTIYAGLAAIALGADLLEVHVTVSREMFGPDVAASVTAAELRQLVEGGRFIEMMRENPVDKDKIAGEMGELRRIFTKSIALRHDLPADTILMKEHLTLKKPGTGIPADHLIEVIGKRLNRRVSRNRLLRIDDLAQDDCGNNKV